MPHSQLLLLYLVLLSVRFLYSLQIILRLSRLFLLQMLLFLNLHSLQMLLHQCLHYSHHTDILPNFLVSLFPLTYYHFEIPPTSSFLNSLIMLHLTILYILQTHFLQYRLHYPVLLFFSMLYMNETSIA